MNIEQMSDANDTYTKALEQEMRDRVSIEQRNTELAQAQVERLLDLSNRLDDRIIAQDALIKELVEALMFYGVNSLGCRMVHREGDVHRQALHDDGGEKARAALAKAKAAQ